MPARVEDVRGYCPRSLNATADLRENWLNGIPQRPHSQLSATVLRYEGFAVQTAADGTAAVNMSYLRKKIDRGDEVALIQTARGFGYSIRRPRE